MKVILSLFFIFFILSGCTQAVETVEEGIKEPEIERKLSSSAKEMRISFIDVGQGDSILLQSPNGQTMLIDGGAKGAGDTVENYLRNQNVKALDYVVATHPDADHIGGLITVLKSSVSIKNFIDSGKVHTSETFEEMLSLIQAKDISYTVPKIGDTISLDEELQIEVISTDENAKDNNEASIVLKVTYGEISILLTGDAGIDMEKRMISAQDMSATILKAGHHGSNTSSSLQFIKEVAPEVTILSYGQDNSYGHPHYEVIENLRQVGSEIYGTAESGDIVVETDGVTYEVFAKEWTGIGATSSIKPKSNGKSTSTITIKSKDLEGEIVAIKNNGTQSVNMEDWQLLSVEGNQTFKFPNVTLQSGQTIYITSGTDAKEGNGYIKWTGRQIWLNSGDAAQLLNPKGEIVSEF